MSHPDPDGAARSPRRVDDGALSGLAWGEPPVEAVLLHGALLNAGAWDQVLARTTFTAIALDLPGHGRSGWYADGDYSHGRMARDIAGFLTGLGARVTLVGHSRGGIVATHVAALAPRAVDRLVIVDADPTRPRPSAAVVPRMRWEGAFDELVDDAHRMRPDLSRDRVADGVRRGAAERADGSWAWRWDPNVRGRATDDEVEQNLAALSAVRCPVSIVRGADSPAVGDDAILRIEAALRRGIGLDTVAGGHNPHSEAPVELARILDALVRATLR